MHACVSIGADIRIQCTFGETTHDAMGWARNQNKTEAVALLERLFSFFSYFNFSFTFPLSLVFLFFLWILVFAVADS